MSRQVELLQGTLVLQAVSLGPTHGYGILLRIQQVSKDSRFRRGPCTPHSTAWNITARSPPSGARATTSARRSSTRLRRRAGSS